MSGAAIDHVQVAIPVGGEDSARAFYGQLLGLVEIEKPENLLGRGGVWFSTDSLELHLGIDPQFRPSTKAHVAFRVPDLDALRGALTAAGYVAQEGEPRAQCRRCYVRDPFGNRTELIQAPR